MREREVHGKFILYVVLMIGNWNQLICPSISSIPTSQKVWALVG